MLFHGVIPHRLFSRAVREGIKDGICLLTNLVGIGRKLVIEAQKDSGWPIGRSH